MSEHFYTLDCIFSSNFLFVVRVNVLFTICLTRFLTPYTNMSVNVLIDITLHGDMLCLFDSTSRRFSCMVAYAFI